MFILDSFLDVVGKIDFGEIVLPLGLVLFLDLPKFLQLGLHLNDLFLGGIDLVADRIDLFAGNGVLDIGQDIADGFGGLDALLLVSVSKGLVVEVPPEVCLSIVHANKFMKWQNHKPERQNINITCNQTRSPSSFLFILFHWYTPRQIISSSSSIHQSKRLS